MTLEQINLLSSSAAYLLLALCIVDVWMRIRHRESLDGWMFYFAPGVAVVASILALMAALLQKWSFATINSGLAVFYAYYWWNDHNHRRKRRKLIEKGKGKVVDAGGKLVVRPEPTTEYRDYQDSLTRIT